MDSEEERFAFVFHKDEKGKTYQVTVEAKNSRDLLRLENLCRVFDIAVGSSASSEGGKIHFYLRRGLAFGRPWMSESDLSSLFACWTHGMFFAGTGKTVDLGDGVFLRDDGDWYVFMSKTFASALRGIEDYCLTKGLVYGYTNDDDLYVIEVCIWQKTEEKRRALEELLGLHIPVKQREAWYKRGTL